VLLAQTTDKENAAVPAQAPPPAAMGSVEVAIAEGGRKGDAETPPEPAAVPISFRSPFSLNDCLNLLAAANTALPEGEDALKQVDRDSYLRLLESVSNYLKERDDLHASLVAYKWEVVERARVRTGLIDSIEFPFQGENVQPGVTVPRNITAISFQVERGDALLHNMKVYDTDGKLVAEFRNPEAVVLRHSLPKREFFFLWQPTDIGRITLAVSKATPEKEVNPRLSVLAGRTNKPEHGKSAIWLIDGAHADVRAGKVEEAREKIRRAQKELRLFRDDVRREDR
jgi:hypothetical protein